MKNRWEYVRDIIKSNILDFKEIEDIIEYEDTNGEKKILKRKAQYRKYIDEENRIIRQKLIPEAFENVEIIDEEKKRKIHKNT